MAEIVVHDNLVILGQEGGFTSGLDQFQPPRYVSDVRIPHVPPGSGVTISFGFDIAASGTTKEQLEELFLGVGVSQEMIDILKHACGVAAGEASLAVLKKHEMHKKVRLTQQQVLDILTIQHQRYQAGVKEAFSKSFDTMHERLREILTKIRYGLPGAMSVLNVFDGKMAAAGTDYKLQCTIMKNDILEKYIKKYPQKPKVHRSHVALTEKLLKELNAGNTIKVLHEPLTVEKLLATDNQTAEWVVEINHNTHGGDKNRDLRAAITNSRDAADLQQPGTKLNPEKLDRLFEIVTKGRYSKNGNNDLKAAQEKLVELGYYDKAGIKGGMKNADGANGPATRKALGLYQKDHQPELKVTGKLDEDTKKMLLGEAKAPAKPEDSTIKPKEDANDSVKSWWDKILEMHAAAQKDAEMAAQEWWKSVMAIHTQGFVGLATALLGGGVTSMLKDAYDKFLTHSQQPEKGEEPLSVAPVPLDAAVYYCFN